MDELALSLPPQVSPLCWAQYFDDEKHQVADHDQCSGWDAEQQRLFLTKLTVCHLRALGRDTYDSDNRFTDLAVYTYTQFMNYFQVYCAQVRHDFRIRQQIDFHSAVLHRYERVAQEGATLVDNFLVLKNLPDQIVNSVEALQSSVESILQGKIAFQLETLLTKYFDGYFQHLHGTFDDQVNRVHTIVVDFMDQVQSQTLNTENSQQELLESWESILKQHKIEMNVQHNALLRHQQYMQILTNMIDSATSSFSRITSAISFAASVGSFAGPTIFFLCTIILIRLLLRRQKGRLSFVMHGIAFVEALIEVSFLLSDDPSSWPWWETRRSMLVILGTVFVLGKLIGCCFYQDEKEEKHKEECMAISLQLEQHKAMLQLVKVASTLEERVQLLQERAADQMVVPRVESARVVQYEEVDTRSMQPSTVPRVESNGHLFETPAAIDTHVMEKPKQGLQTNGLSSETDDPRLTGEQVDTESVEPSKIPRIESIEHFFDTPTVVDGRETEHPPGHPYYSDDDTIDSSTLRKRKSPVDSEESPSKRRKEE